MEAKVLLIEDDKDMCFLLETFLGRKGFEVKAVETGQEGIELYDDEYFDMVLCDFSLTDMDGKEVLKELLELDSDLIFFVITGHADVHLAVEMMRLGARDYLVKPLIPDELVHKLSQALPNLS
jgi:two-component system response regulator HydG